MCTILVIGFIVIVGSLVWSLWATIIKHIRKHLELQLQYLEAVLALPGAVVKLTKELEKINNRATTGLSLPPRTIGEMRQQIHGPTGTPTVAPFPFGCLKCNHPISHIRNPHNEGLQAICTGCGVDQKTICPECRGDIITPHAGGSNGKQFCSPTCAQFYLASASRPTAPTQTEDTPLLGETRYATIDTTINHTRLYDILRSAGYDDKKAREVAEFTHKS